MNQDFDDMFSVRGAYVDNDGIAPGDNLYGAPDPGFTSSEYREPQRSVARQPVNAIDTRTERIFWACVRAGLVVVAAGVVWLLLWRL